MRVKEVGAFREQPDEFVAGDLRLAGPDHRLHLLDVLLAAAAAPRVNKLPRMARRRLAANHREFFLGAARPPARAPAAS